MLPALGRRLAPQSEVAAAFQTSALSRALGDDIANAALTEAHESGEGTSGGVFGGRDPGAASTGRCIEVSRENTVLRQSSMGESQQSGSSGPQMRAGRRHCTPVQDPR